MAYIKFKDSEKLIHCIVHPVGTNIITLQFPDAESIEVNTSGLDVFLDPEGKKNIGGDAYADFTTIFRNDGVTAEYNGYQLSNDGSVYTLEEYTPESPVEPIVPAQPTLDQVQESKIYEMNTVQQKTIQAGIDVTLTDGTVEHFSLTDHDQTSLMGLQSQVAAGVDQIPWHTSNQSEHCKYYSNEDMQRIISAALSYVTYHVTYFRDLRIYIRSLDNIDDVKAITYGILIPEDYQSEPLKAMIAAQIS